MTTGAATRRRVPRRYKVAGSLLLVLLGLVVASMALFGDVTANPGLQIGVGTVDVASAPVSIVLTSEPLVPGQVTAAPVVVRNDGTLQLRYAISSTVTEAPLADLLTLEIRVGVSSCTAVGADDDGTVLAGPVRLGSTSGEAVLGDPSGGGQPGDRVLDAGASETLCVRVQLPATVDEATAAGLTTRATLRFDAEQTAANP